MINKSLVIDSMVLINGNAQYGGAVSFHNGDSLIIKNSLLYNNSADYGGGIYVNSNSYLSPNRIPFSMVKVINSKILNNSSNNEGGGVFCRSYSYTNGFCSNSKVNIFNSSISENISAGSGAGVYSHAASYSSDSSSYSSILISKSTISGNISSYNGGGGVYSSTFTGEDSTKSQSIIIINNVTIVNNSSVNDDGGGVYSYSQSSYSSAINLSLLFITNSTILGNFSNNIGGGIYSDIFPTQATNDSNKINIKSSIVAHNSTSNIFNTEIPTIISQGYNIFSDTSLSGSLSNDYLAISLNDINLSVLGNYGGETKTMIPNSSSLAINNGNPLDFSDAQNSSVIGIRDIGAAESICSSQTTDYLISCDSLTWINGVTYYQSNFTDKDTLINYLGCDSIISLNLIINKINDSVYKNDSSYLVKETSANYQWLDCNNNYQEIQGDTNIYLEQNIAGNYCVKVSKNGCIDTSECVLITDCNAKYHQTQIIPGEVILIDSTLGSNLKYTWFFGDGDSSNLELPSHVYSIAGTYEVCLLIQDTINLCNDYYCDSIYVDTNGILRNSFTIRVVRNMSNVDYINKSSIKLYPNPTSGDFEVFFDKNYKKIYTYIIDINGKVVNKSIYEMKSKISLNITGKRGVYFLKIITNENTTSFKIIKTN